MVFLILEGVVVCLNLDTVQRGGGGRDPLLITVGINTMIQVLISKIKNQQLSNPMWVLLQMIAGTNFL